MVASATGSVAASSKFMLDGRDAEQPAVIGQRVFGKRRAARAHHPVADLDALGVGADFGDLAGPFHAEHGADAAGRAMRVALGHAEVGAVEAVGADADQHLRALRRGLCDIGDFSAVGAVDIGFHGIILSVNWLIVIASVSEAIQFFAAVWIASSQGLLAMTELE